MKIPLKILDSKTAKWWKNVPTDWAVQKGDDWYIYRHEDSSEDKLFQQKQMQIDLKRNGERSNKVDSCFLLILLSAVSGVSLALNIIFYLLK
tara:strand:+ start:300 stop:575 length:276 start_codon:yes stop_codon:yes gene_type:complete